ncbi:MAG: class I SAM-dependent methyltransferase [Pirellulales bacterium]
MSNPAELADYEWLVGDEAAVVLRDLAGRDEPLHTLAGRLRKQFSTERSHLLLEQVELRERARAKFARAEEMFFTRIGLEQATDEWVAWYKARRFAEVAAARAVTDLCCGIGGDLLALGEVAQVVGVDRDDVSGTLAAANARALGRDQNVKVEAADVDAYELGQHVAWHLDPDRRPQGRRTTALAWSSPGTETIERLLSASPHAAVKLAPAADLPAAWEERCELEWISRDRECRQLVAWHGSLARDVGKRCATVLSVDGKESASFAGEANVEFSYAPLDQFLFEPDPAVLAAQLAGAFGDRHGLSALSPGIAYLTGPQAIDSPLLACFAVNEVLPLDLRKISDALCVRHIGRLEIKKRGVDHDPQRVRKQLRVGGDNEATLLLTKLNGKHAAILAQRCEIPAPIAALNTQP